MILRVVTRWIYWPSIPALNYGGRFARLGTWLRDWLPVAAGYPERWMSPREYAALCVERWRNRKLRPSPTPAKGERRYLHVDVPNDHGEPH